MSKSIAAVVLGSALALCGMAYAGSLPEQTYELVATDAHGYEYVLDHDMSYSDCVFAFRYVDDAATIQCRKESK